MLDNFMVNEIPEFAGQEESYWVNPDIKLDPKYTRTVIDILANMSNDDIVRSLNILNDHQDADFNKISYFKEAAKKMKLNGVHISFPTNKQSRYMLMQVLKNRNLLTDLGNGNYMYYSNKSPYALIWDSVQKKLY